MSASDAHGRAWAASLNARTPKNAWLAEFDAKRSGLLAMLYRHHRPDKSLSVDLPTNLRAIGMIEDGCLIARSLAEHGTEAKV